MNVSHKCQYALRAVLELAKRHGGGPTTIAEVAEAQALPLRFLELILNELKHLGIVVSRRGPRGGYLLAERPEDITVGKIIGFVDGSMAPVPCVAGPEHTDCPFCGGCAFINMWRRAHEAMADIYNETTFQDLIEEETAARRRMPA